MVNLEALAATAAARMVGPDAGAAQRMINKSLLVLAEQGVFAFGLFLASRKREEDVRAADDLHAALRDLLAKARLDGRAAPAPAPARTSVASRQAAAPATPAVNERDKSAYYRALTQQRDGETEAAAIARLILTKQLIEIALTYGRYQSRAAGA